LPFLVGELVGHIKNDMVIGITGKDIIDNGMTTFTKQITHLVTLPNIERTLRSILRNLQNE
jgi:hypothetical protein